MSETGSNTGVAFIDVDDSTHVTVTKKVKAVAKAAVWVVHNKTGSSVKVGVANIRSAGGGGGVGAGGGGPVPNHVYPDALTTSNPTNPIPPGGQAAIVLAFTLPDGLYVYDVTVNGTVAIDPELEI